MIYSDSGIVRILEQFNQSFQLKYAIRLHDNPIIGAFVSNDGSLLATSTADTVFISRIIANESLSIVPVAFCKSKQIASISSEMNMANMFWTEDTNDLVAFSSDKILLLKNPASFKPISEETFEANFEINSVSLNLPGLY